MQPKKLRQRFGHVENTVVELTRTYTSHEDMPDALKQSIQQLGGQAYQCHSCLEGARDPWVFVKAIDGLEACSDYAEAACQSASDKVDYLMEPIVMRIHKGLSQLKHKLH